VQHTTRRHFLTGSLHAVLGASLATAGSHCPASIQPQNDDPVADREQPQAGYLATRGIVVLASDLISLPQWPQLASSAGLNTLGIGPVSMRRYLRDFLTRDAGQQFLATCQALNLQVEHELHMMTDLLPRHLYDRDPSMFRMNDAGERVRDHNCCVHSRQALEIIAENALRYAAEPISTTGRYFFWTDDAVSMCRCPQCRGYSDGDQSLILENHIIRALRQRHPHAQLAHLAYVTTADPPRAVKPEPGIFLEFAPIQRSHMQPLSNRTARLEGHTITHGQVLDQLDANLELFGSADARILEYWLDVSRFSSWKRPAVALPWRPEVVADDLQAYTDRGIRHITCYGAWIDDTYLATFGKPPLREYGELLRHAGPNPGVSR